MSLKRLTSPLLSAINHGFYTRLGGASSGIFEGLNCGTGSSDQAEIVQMVPKDRIINFALDQVEAKTGRDISVGGDAELKIFPNLVVVANQVSVANADSSDRGAMIYADP